MKEVSALLVQLSTPAGEWVDVGILHRREEITWFESLRTYWENPDRPVLGQIFEDRGPEWRPSKTVVVPYWFSHLLPEGRLREAVATAANVNGLREFFLLARIGQDDLPGAVRVVPTDAATDGRVAGTAESDDGDDNNDAVLKFSLAGVQLKFSVVEGENRGLTIPASGDIGRWIVKLPDGRRGFDGVPEAEFASLELARAAGIRVPPARLVHVNDIARIPAWARESGGLALAIERFDRTPDGRRVHAEQLAQVLDIPTGKDFYKYKRTNFETIASNVAAFCGADALGEVVDRIVLNTLLGNGDAHAKNWALVYPDGRRPELSPAFDIVPTVLWMGEDDLGLKLRDSLSFRDVNAKSFDRLAFRSGVDVSVTRSRVSDAVGRIMESWPVLKDLLPAEAYERLSVRAKKLPVARE